MKTGRSLPTVMGLVALASCASMPPTDPVSTDIDFVRGCWVKKDEPGGKAEAFLRLLPDSSDLSGQVIDVATNDWITAAAFHFSRTGESVRFDARDMPEQPIHARIDPSRLAASFEWARPKHGGSLAAYAGPAPSRSFLFVEGGDDRLALWVVDAASDGTLIYLLFDGERDGCD